jgi:cytochrome c biogenesis protein CcmG, thiol:disulfide interchange protein DsbE
VPEPTRPRPLWFRVTLWLIPALVFLGFLAVGLSRSGSAPGPGDRAPAWSAPALQGEQTVSLDDFQGRPVLLNFWASWCVPCIDEAPMLRRAQETYGDRVAIVGVDIRDSSIDATEFVERYRLDYTHIRDESLTIYDDYGLSGQPETFLIDGNGVIVEHIRGAFTDEAHLVSLLESVAGDG